MRSRSLREGSAGLLILAFVGVTLGLVAWIRGFSFGQDRYSIFVEFANANRLKTGAVVRYRGVRVGKIAAMNPSANGVEAEIEIDDRDLRIPQDVAVVANQTGLVGETSVDIIPQTTLSSQALSLSPIGDECNSRLIVCDEDRISGQSGADFQELIDSTVELTEKLSDPE